MVESIELLLDEDGDAAIRAQWAALAAAGLPSLASHTGASNRPHVTLAVTEAGFAPHVEALRATIGEWDLAEAPLPATLGSVLLFPARSGSVVMVRPFAEAGALGAARRGVLTATRAERPARLWSTWTPHITLARRLTHDHVGRALDVLDLHAVEVRFTAARLWQSATKTVTPLS